MRAPLQMFAILSRAQSLNAKFCSQMDGRHCITKDTTEIQEGEDIGDVDATFKVCNFTCVPLAGIGLLLFVSEGCRSRACSVPSETVYCAHVTSCCVNFTEPQL